MKRAVFLDRDGTLNVERKYLCDPDKLELFPDAGRALRKLQDAGFLLVVVTNQSGIGRGYYTEADMHRVNDRMKSILARDGVQIAGIYFSPEAPGEPSRTRKPLPGMLLAAQADLGITLTASYMVGDKLIDLECGWSAGVRRSLLVRTGYGAEWERNAKEALSRAVVVNNLSAAAKWIIADAGR